MGWCVMGRPRTRANIDAGPVVPPALYYGLVPGAFRYLGSDRPSPDVSRHAEWSRAVREAGWTVSALRNTAATDPAYLAFVRARDRRSRLTEDDPGRAG
jgi:hypothetical protein